VLVGGRGSAIHACPTMLMCPSCLLLLMPQVLDGLRRWAAADAATPSQAPAKEPNPSLGGRWLAGWLQVGGALW
jgi:hypothetical protein